MRCLRFYILISFLFSYSTISNAAILKSGIWRGVIQLNDSTPLPFNFEVKNSEGKTSIVIMNSEEHILVDEIVMSGDSVFIQMPVFDSEFRCRYTGDSLTGSWLNHSRKDHNKFRFTATAGTTYRFRPNAEIPYFSVGGRYEVTFSPGTKDSSKAILILGLTSTQTIGTFLTESGDYRYLEGILKMPYLYLSCFDGSHAFLFKGKFKDDKIIGEFYSGGHWYEKWTAVENNLFELRNPYSLSHMKPGHDSVRFSFPNLEGKQVSISDTKFAGKVVILQLMGSWCPNCMDETRVLQDFNQKYKDRGLVIEGIAFERETNPERAVNNLKRMKTRLGADYEILLTGKTGAKAASESFPMINEISAFPTTIFIDKKGIVRRIHTGINGPATGKYYQEWLDETKTLIEKLLAE